MTLDPHADAGDNDYLQALAAALRRASAANGESLPAAAVVVADVVAGGGIVYVFGSGHSQLAALELNVRAGVFAPLQVIFDPAWARAEHLEGYGGTLLGDVEFTPDDCLVAISNSGSTAPAIEIALRARSSGAKVVAVTSAAVARATPARHSSGQKLGDLADVVLDTAVPSPDGAVCVPGVADPIGPASTLVTAALLHDVVVRAAARLAGTGIEPPLYRANSAPGGRDHNLALRRRYAGRIRIVP